MLTPVLRERALVGLGEIMVAIVDRAGRRHVEAAENVQQRGFSAARGSKDDDELGLEQIEIDPAERLHLDLAHAVDLGKVAGFEDGRLLHLLLRPEDLAGILPMAQ
jgi:hypothetical protein